MTVEIERAPRKDGLMHRLPMWIPDDPCKATVVTLHRWPFPRIKSGRPETGK